MSTENQEVDVFSMSADEFAKFEGSLDSQVFEPEEDTSEGSDTELDSDTQETTDETDAEVHTQESDDDEFVDVEGADDEIEDEDDASEENTQDDDGSTSDDDTESDDSETDSDTIDFESEYRKLIGSPIKANGKEIKVDNMDDAIRLIQMGANYYKKVEQLKPAQKIIAMLESKEMLDESKLSFAIDLLNKNPQAINKLISGMDLNEIIDDTKGEYKPTDYSVSDNQIALDEAIKEIADTPTFNKTIEVIGNKWDSASRNIIKQNPQAIGLINQHIESGIFDTVTAEVEKRKMLGTIPSGLSDIEAYKYVGDSLYANQNSQAAPNAQNGQQQNGSEANVKPPIKKPSKDTVVKQKKAASKPRGKPSVSKEIEDVYALSSEEFEAKYGKYF